MIGDSPNLSKAWKLSGDGEQAKEVTKECDDPEQCATEAMVEAGRPRDAFASLIRRTGAFFERDREWKEKHAAWQREITETAARAAAEAAANRAELERLRNHIENFPCWQDAEAFSSWWRAEQERIKRAAETREALKRDLLRYVVLGLVGLAVLALALGLPEAIRRTVE